MKNFRILLLLAGCPFLSMQAQSALAAVAGHVQFVHGTVQVATPGGQVRTIQKGEVVNEGDTLTSAADASAQIRMQDGGLIAVRPDTRMKFDQFRFSGKEDGEERSFFSLFKGGFRAVTGLIGRINKQNYKITTPSATIGIRGTDHETYEIVPGSALAQVAPVGTYSKVNTGGTTLTTDRGTINVLPNQMGFAGGRNQVPQLQPINTNIFTVAPAPAEKNRPGAKPAQQSEGGGNTEGTSAEEPVRETAVVDTAAPTGGAAPAAATPAADTGGGATPVVQEVAQSVVLPVNGQTINLTDQTITSPTGTITPITPTTVVTAPYVQNDFGVAFVTGSSTYLSRFVQLDILIASPADINNTLPSSSFTDRYAGKDTASYVTYTLNGTTTVGQATTTLANGIQFGRYDSTSAQVVAVGNTSCCTAGTASSNTAVYSHWIAGPAVNPVYLPEVLTTTATYTYAGGTAPTVAQNITGAPGTATLNGASLSVDFTQQLVAFNLSLMVNGAAWTASTTGTPLEIMYWNSAKVGFRATTAARSGWGTLTVTGASGGDVVGQLTGNGLDGAILSYVLNNGANNDQVTGVAAFTGTAQNTATPYRIAALSTIDTIPSGLTNAGQVVPVTMGGYNNSGSVLFDAAGNATQFGTDKPFSTGGGAITVDKGTATVAGLGTDPVSGISWGRWVGGALTVTDRISNTTTTLANNNSSHWIAGPVMTGPVSLPVSGTYNYVLAGGTAPTDSLGGVGTLNMNGTTLSANFTAQTVNIRVDVTTPNAGNLVATGNNIPIEQKSFFGAATANSLNGGPNVGTLTVTCPGGCGGSVVSGHVGGVFTGTGGIGAGMVYGLQKGTVFVNGVTAFHR
jgi:hypothetical protein